MRKSFRVFLCSGLVLAAVAGFFLLSCSKDDGGDDNNSGTAQWTIMMYGAGNNNLDVSNNNTSFIIQDAQDMEKVGSQAGMNIVAMVASMRTGGQAKVYHIEQHTAELPDSLSSPWIDKGSKDMSDPATLREFINYCKANYPAQKYLLVVDDHGAGWPGSCSDEMNGGGGMLTMPELKSAIAQSDLQHVDIVTFHACLMAMAEVAYELRSVASYMTACQFTMPMQNILGADLWLGWLKDNTGASPADLAHKIAEKVRVAAENKQKTSHYAMIDLSQMQTLSARVGTFSNVLVTEGGQHWNEVQHAWSQTHATQYDNPAYCDLREFANKILAEPTLSTINLVRNAANDIISGINGAVPYTATYFYPPDQPMPRGGLNIHFPSQLAQFDSSNYVTLEFRATNWHAFLSTFLRAGGTQPEQGRCCYNNNASCAVNTQAECAQLGGNWTQGIDCNTPCQQATTCPAACAQAVQISVGQTITQCTFTAQATENWFYVTLNPGTFRFQLGNFPNGADYDCYTFLQCSDYPNSPTTCRGDAVGPEDFTCTVQNSPVQVLVLINAYQAPYGGYAFLISQTGVLPDGGDEPTIAIR
ncbi:hypothetical protein EHM69_07535 [candidate division KSB1 bacterium]|nr:MAG: hypothetical protein EHM69_07535 [candidate division KSB1 bacterium]